ncbi:hypothetical protein [Cognataquiflexum rubidum]|uniref:hypothetical protein n=1 Tax=Cognataquiflexum rubidum TaxID=2922273 RepID=UPI001F12E2B9|nr:hypothetical protein [Cognataquiflexum rubidum]MCH6235247.1 hypothetical protein [Cognataquiflexum rubidum]
MEDKLKLLCLFFGLFSLSCTRYEDLSKIYRLPPYVSFSGYDTLVHFQENKEYHLTLLDKSEFYFLVDKKSKESISGYITPERPRLEFPKDKYHEVKLQHIVKARVRVFDRAKTISMFALLFGTLILSAVFIIILLAKPANESERFWMF